MKIDNVYMLLPGREVGFGSIEFENGVITSIGRDGVPSPSAASASTGRACRSATAGFASARSNRLLLPGLINCHGHTAMTLVRGVGSGLPLQRWLNEAIFPIEAKMTKDDIRAGVLWGAMEMLAGGTTTVADMYDFPDEGERAFLETGLRAKVSRVGLSFVPGRLEECIAFTRADANRDLCIHSEYLTDEPFCRALADVNRELKRRLHVHVSETKKEHEECIARHNKTPIAYLAATGLLDHGGYAAHCVYCTDDDFRIMADHDVSLVHNPTSNMKLGSGFARVQRAMELGVNVALGTDGCASNDNLDMFEEMHLASLIHKGLASDPTVLSAWDVIEMATKNGAKALGRDDLGALAVGKAADFCVIDLDRLHLTPALDLPNLVVNSMHASDVIETWIGGERLYYHGAFEGLDISAIKETFLNCVSRLQPTILQ